MTPYGIIDSDDRCPTHLAPGQCKKGDYISRELWGRVGGLTYTEQRTHFAFWCMLAAPLMLGNDPRRMSAATKRILMARELLAINQDPLGKQARRIWREGPLAIWRKELASGGDALLLFNGGSSTADITARWTRDLPDASKPYMRTVPREPPCADKQEVAQLCAGWAGGGECTKNAGYMKSNCPASCNACPPAKWDGQQAIAHVRNVWEEEDEGEFTALYTALHVEPHEARLIIVRFGPADTTAPERPKLRGLLPKPRPQPQHKLVPKRRQHATRGGGGGGTVAPSEEPEEDDAADGSALRDETGGGRGIAASHRHAVHDQHRHEARPPTLATCTHEYGTSLLLLYLA